VAVEIIKRGKPKGEKVYKFSCRECKSQLRAKAEDGTLTPDRNEEFMVFVCPVCKMTIWMKP